MSDEQFKALWQVVLNNTTVADDSIRGPQHWLRVERNGLYLSRFNGANETVVQLFALFHDCMRLNDGTDDGHGQRGAEHAKQLRSSFLEIDDDSFDLLYLACSGHTDQLFDDDVTIATCWDADRLDLGRVGIVPDPAFLNTEEAKRIAQESRLDYLEQIPIRRINERA